MANLTELIGLFDATSGRSSLAPTEKAYYINQGMRMLDRMGNHEHARGRIVQELAAGQYKLMVPDTFRAVHASWIETSSAGKIRMRKKELSCILSTYPDMTDTSCWGTPKWWALEYGTVLDVFGGSIDSVEVPINHVDDMIDSRADTRQFVFGPPNATAGNLVVMHGIIFTPTLTKVYDTNYWSLLYSDLVIYAAMYVYDSFHRNDAGAQEWMMKIRAEMSEVIKDQTENDMSDMTMQMEG